jgi:hypothetical protein
MRETPREQSGGATHAPGSKSNCPGILLSPDYIVNQWETEKQRLWSEYQRTGNPAHLKAFEVHRAAMSARLANTARAKYR